MSAQTDKLEQPQQEPVAWMSDDDIDRICDELSLGARGRASFRAGLRYARDIARPAHSRTTEPIAWWNPVNDVALCKSEIERRNGDKGACSIPLYSRPTWPNADVPAMMIAFARSVAQPSEPRLTVDQLREEMELLGSMIRAERSTATEANRQCTDEQLERCYQLGDRLTKAAQ